VPFQNELGLLNGTAKAVFFQNDEEFFDGIETP
jgi:hypothetical protein